jgi:hypothetical protein
MNTLNFLDANAAFAYVAGLKLMTFDRGLRSQGVDVHIL